VKLLVIRHAIAIDREDFDEPNDDHRPLTPEGIRKMRKNVKGLRGLVDRPDFLVTSPLTRAVQTAEIVRDAWIELDIASCDELRPESEPGEFLSWLREQPQGCLPDGIVAIVGHEPHLSSFIGWLLSGSFKSFVSLKKGGACLIEFADRVEKGEGRLLWHLPPSVLRGL
jgi:phosphohistidine phosphatase